MTIDVIINIEETEGGVPVLSIHKPDGSSQSFQLEMVANFFVNEWEVLEAIVVAQTFTTGDRVLEAGAGSGQTTLDILKTGAECVPVEPQPDVFEVMCHNLMKNGHPKLTVVRAGVMDKTGSVVLNIPNVSFGASVVDEQRETGARRYEIPCYDVNEMLERVDCNCLHLDVEGAEVQILKGLDFDLVNKITMEVHPSIIGFDTYTDVIEPMLTEAGFEMVSCAGVSRNFPTHNYAVGWSRK